MLLYTDASTNDSVVGIGYYLEPTFEQMKSIEGSTYLIGNYTSMEGEYHALIHGAAQANKLGVDTLYIHSDCEPLLDKMYFPDAENNDWFERRAVFHKLMQNFDVWKTVHIPRTMNQKADSMATIGRYRGEDTLCE